MVCEDAIMTVGDTPAVAKAKSTFSPATELRAMEEFANNAAMVWQSG
jgi:hypothetical protein